jgi:hypothetical protein
MHVLAIGTLTGKNIEPHLPAEAKHVNKLREKGLIRDVFLKADQTGPILLLNDVDASGASERLASLPFITEELATFDFVELITLAEAQERRRAQGSA